MSEILSSTSSVDDSKFDKVNSTILECIDIVLSENFDAVSTSCIITVTKYVCNIISDPLEVKYQTISLTNKAFVEKILPAKGSIDLICSLGFQRNPTCLQLTSPVDTLHRCLVLLYKSMDRLQISDDVRPRPKINNKQQPIQSESVSSDLSNFAFDPFKSNTISTAPQVNFN